MSLLKGSAFITGAASGIGKATAFAFAKHGIKALFLTDMNASTLEQTTSSLRSKYPDLKILHRELDVCNGNDVESSVAEAIEKFKRLDVAVNVAGIGKASKLTHELDMADWMKIVDVNLHGVFRSQRAQLKHMMKQDNLGLRLGRGNIINISSIHGLIGTPSHIPAAAYVASKHGVIGLTRSDAVGYAAHGIRINAVCPGYVATPLLKAAMSSGAADAGISRTPMGRLAEPEEIADSITYLASELASFVTGSHLVVDGGYTVN